MSNLNCAGAPCGRGFLCSVCVDNRRILHANETLRLQHMLRRVERDDRETSCRWCGLADGKHKPDCELTALVLIV